MMGLKCDNDFCCLGLFGQLRMKNVTCNNFGRKSIGVKDSKDIRVSDKFDNLRRKCVWEKSLIVE